MMKMKMLAFYSVKEGIDEGKYTEYLARSAKNLQDYKDSGAIVEFTPYKNLLGSPEEVMEIVWRSVEDWAKFYESRKYQAIRKMGEEFSRDARVIMLQSS